ncbi:TRAP transporter small permease subunit [Methylobacterium sp. 37f]|uniref:TRAP transporter small permease subunit n=1 Tax=Methylobacterium sp. 37f TaxID=2817058 RepID=UPI001FFC6CFA|nr:TRAP transporter small permease subunit [Methylobacterium sp. 37f]MCK2056356.1 TRAP transporter small permease subunit [Methylobacterium sp. 37f]
MLRLSHWIDALNERIGKLAAWAIVAAVIVSTLNAIVRKLFGTSSNAWLELQWYLFGAVFMLCAAWTLKDNEHIRIDIVSSRLSKRGRDLVDVFGHLFFLLPFLAVMIWLTTPFFLNSFNSAEVSTNAGGLLIWPAKGLILLGFVLLGLQWLSELIKRLLILSGRIEDRTNAGGHHAAAESEAERLVAELAGEPAKAAFAVDPKAGPKPAPNPALKSAPKA